MKKGWIIARPNGWCPVCDRCWIAAGKKCPACKTRIKIKGRRQKESRAILKMNEKGDI